MKMTKSLMVLAIGLASLIAVHAAAPPGILGVTVKVEGGWLTIMAVHEQLPASQEGLRAGDRITRIDGQSTQNKGIEERLQFRVEALAVGNRPIAKTNSLCRAKAPSSVPVLAER